MGDKHPEATTKAFLSYSWTSREHEKWVITLATRLREDGVDVVLDKWDLKPGHDAYKFMEQMVTDESVTKVVIICDRIYTEKADARQGGVGTESQIISPELYGKATQDKFAAVIAELDDGGKPFVPTFYKGRIYFDLSSPERFEDQYEELIRWIVDKPQLVKPSIGKLPQHISDPNARAPATVSRCRRADDAIRAGSTLAVGHMREFADAMVNEFEALRISKREGVEFDDLVVESVESFRPYVTQICDLTVSIARYTNDARAFDELLRLLERLARFMFRPVNVTSWGNWDFDNYKFVCHELFLVVFAVLLNEERFDLAERMLLRRYLVQRDDYGESRSNAYSLFCVHLESFDARNRRLNLQRRSLHADFLKKAYEHHVPNFVDLMQADFVLYIRAAIEMLKADGRPYWYPLTLIYASRRGAPFPIFARSESRTYLATISSLLGLTEGYDMQSVAAALIARQHVPQFDYFRLEIDELSNIKNLGLTN